MYERLENEKNLVIEEYTSSLNILEPEYKLKNVEAFKEKAFKAFNEIEPQIHVTFGNAKLPETTAIVSCGTWFNCPGRTEGFCNLATKCYDKCREVMSHKITKFRLEEEIAFRALTAKEIADSIIIQIKLHNAKPSTKNIKQIRWNEVGELRNQNDLNKMVEISNILYKELSIKSYTYTHNKYLNFDIERPYLTINGSGFMVDNEYRVLPKDEVSKVKEKHFDCDCDCTKCNVCAGKYGIVIIEELRQ